MADQTEQTRVSVTQLHHINFPTTNPDRTAEFYDKIFGIQVAPGSDVENDGVLILREGEVDLHFMVYPEAEKPELDHVHFALEVTDWDAFMENLEASGVEHDEPIERRKADSGSWTVFMHDPDGNELEATYHPHFKAHH